MQSSGAIISDNLFGQRAGQLCAAQFAAGKITAVTEIGPADAQSIIETANGDTVIDARGLLVLPGLIDSHVHAVATGMMAISESVSEVTTLDELSAAIQRATASSDKVVRLLGMDLSRLRKADHPLLTRAWLDAQLSDRVLIIKGVEGHSAWFNTRGWEMVLDQRIVAEEGTPAAELAAMYESGRLHGGLYEKHTTPIYDSYSHEERREGMQRVIQAAKRAGLCGIHCLEGYGDHRRNDFELILGLDGQDIDLTLYCRDENPKLAKEMGVPRFGGCWCIDGAIGSHSAAISEPYLDRPGHCGELYFSDEVLSNWIESGIKEGMQICLHAIGDRAVEQGLRCFEGLAEQHDHVERRHRVDHFILGDKAQATRAARLGICSGVQPVFDARWGGESGGYSMRLGKERAMQTNPVASLQGCGMRVSGGSDAYITPLDPLGGMRAAMYHHNEAERVDFDAAVRLFSEDAAYLCHDEGNRGRIAAGQYANFTIVSGDRTLRDATVAATVWRGKQVYRTNE